MVKHQLHSWKRISRLLGKGEKIVLGKEQVLAEVESLEKDMSGRGGPRHKAKPHLDTDLLYQILAGHKDLVQDMGSYEYIGTSSAPDIRGLVRNMDLWVALGKVSPQQKWLQHH